MNRQFTHDGARILREDEGRTYRGAKFTVRETLHAPGVRGHREGQQWRTVRAQRHDGDTLAEYRTIVPGNAAMVYELFKREIFDLQTPLADLPGDGLSVAMGKAWLAAERAPYPERDSRINSGDAEGPSAARRRGPPVESE